MLKVELRFDATQYDLVKFFRVSTDSIDKMGKKYLCPQCKQDTTFTMDDDMFCCTNDKCSYSGYYSEDMKLTPQDCAILDNNLLKTKKPHLHMLKFVRLQCFIYGLTRQLSIEYLRHHIGKDDIQMSTRYTLGRMKNDEDINDNCVSVKELEPIISRYYYIPEEDFYDEEERTNWLLDRYKDMQNIKKYKLLGVKNDKLKKYTNEHLLTLIGTNLSLLALRNMLNQRVEPEVLYQFRLLVKEIYEKIPECWKPYIGLNTKLLKEIK